MSAKIYRLDSPKRSIVCVPLILTCRMTNSFARTWMNGWVEKF